MKKTKLIVALLFVFSLATNDNVYARYDSLSKTAAIVHLRIDCTNPGFETSQLLTPLYSQLKRVFKLDSIVNLQEQTILWTDGLFHPKEEKELKPEELKKALAIKPDLIVVIEIDHWAETMLVAKGTKQMMSMTCAIYDRSGKRVWQVKKKDSCCRAFEFGTADFTNKERLDIDTESFMTLYKSVLNKVFGNL